MNSQKQLFIGLYRITLVRIFAKVIGKHRESQGDKSFYGRVAGLQLAALLKKRLRQVHFYVDFTKVFKIAYLQSRSGQLFLKSEVLVTLRNTQSLRPTYFHNET